MIRAPHATEAECWHNGEARDECADLRSAHDELIERYLHLHNAGPAEDHAGAVAAWEAAMTLASDAIDRVSALS